MPGWSYTRSVVAAAFVALIVGLAIVSPLGLTMMSPALVLVAAVWLGLFTGERPIVWIRRVARRLRRRVATPAQHAPALPVRAARAGRVLAFALAMRPPPHRALAL